MADQPKSAPDKAKEDEKQLKKLLDSYTTVATHKLGRPPTLEDLTKMLTENAGQEKLGGESNETPVASKPVADRSTDFTSDTKPRQPAQGTQSAGTANGAQTSQPLDKAEPQPGEPKILRMQIFYGMKGEGEARKPDQGHILFYKHPDGRFYDTTTQEWSDTQPAMCQHLPSRPIQFNERDIVGAIAHGIMDDQDYEALDKAQMIGPTPRRLWDLTKKLGGLHGDLQKSEEMPDTDADPEVDPELVGGATESSGGVDAVGEFLHTAGVERSQPEQGGDVVGEDLLRQIMEAAVGAVADAMEERMGDTQAVNADLESKIRAIVREELQKAMGGQDLPGETDPGTMQEL